MREVARIIESHGKSFIVELAEGRRYIATTRKKKTDYAVGDQVEVGILNEKQAVIEKALPRSSLLYRSDEWREKLIAANVTQIVVVLAAVPSFYEELLSRCLVAAEDADIRVLILLNKADLPETAAVRPILAPYCALGYPMLELSAQEDVSPLWAYLVDQTSVFVGQSGMGKSTLVNALLPEVKARTNEISVALDSGKHTTTHATLYRLPHGGELIDSPGLQEFGMRHLPADRLVPLFPEFRPYIGQCRFHNCRHDREPNCALIAALERGEILPQRLNLLRKLRAECGA
ncbi:ribosome small subunit-dependent GTPase A [Chitinimonas sp. BJB300]|uniref:ribosome small subunit-dependent GTPase A n=1 Tax=Chitinimonas sp. BJB300 TaxID=1559339 RepID=UPI000C0F81BE|nr:ribosome small subunit-dependent GTPase A [Chitinimonas sp. BJB300]PHV10769.1 ribosome small subunit-dependent GTPase A [Chitinimonas sp. BJB300]TSJ84523.1 ribosome small subunit-dependent GTPase A [Chitinimonas sp. BJB300]